MTMRMMLSSNSISKAKGVSLVVTPMLTGSLSFLASLTIIISILRSEVKLSTSYRRLLFGLSVFDLFHSLGQALSSTPMPVGTFLLSFGNDSTCITQAFISTLGLTGTIVYSLSLTVYFLLVVKYDVHDDTITTYVEPFLHAVPILYSSTISIYALVTKNYNLDDHVGSCIINPRPTADCYDNPSVECIGRGNPDVLAWILCGTIISIFVANCIMLVMIWLAVHFQVKKSQAYRYSWMTSSRVSEPGHTNTGTTSSRFGTTAFSFLSTSSRFTSTHATTARAATTRNQQQQEDGETEQVSSPTSASTVAERLYRPSRKLRETSNRAIGYVVGFLLTYTLALILGMIMIIRSSILPPFGIILLTKFFLPLQGFFNVIVYTYPHVVSYRRNHSEYSWVCAFWKVVKNGGDSTNYRQPTQRRRSSLGRKFEMMKKKDKKEERPRYHSNDMLRNKAANSMTLPSPSAVTAEFVGSATPSSSARGRRKAESVLELCESITNSPNRENYGACDEEESISYDIDTNNSLFPIAPSSSMKSDSGDGMNSPSYENRDYRNDSNGRLYLRVSEEGDLDDSIEEER